jgi:UDP-N-acetylmuramoylalanine--D-glutamate ligase
MHGFLQKLVHGKLVVILGFGREGQSTYAAIRSILPGFPLTIADADPDVARNPLVEGDRHISWSLGPGYLENLAGFDLIIKSPGISLKDLPNELPGEKITSQTDLFLRNYARQVTGVTGTKGKSTTSSLIFHILKNAGKETLLLGNIGTPAFHFLDQITPSSHIIYELSSHQLEYIGRGPQTAVLLNLYQEHLDAYRSYEAYQLAKMNIARHRNTSGFFIYNSDDPLVSRHAASLQVGRTLLPFTLEEMPRTGTGLIGDRTVIRIPGREQMTIPPFENRYLRGEHNLRNILAAVTAAALAGATSYDIAEGLDSFKGLAHRMEYVGRFGGIDFYNDSIATIPEACEAAIRSIPAVDTLVAGGFDRGIDYTNLAAFLAGSAVRNIILTGPAGERIGEELKRLQPKDKQVFHIRRFDEFLPLAAKYTRPGYVCLLSPAAASYDEFRSFEERGMRYADLVRTLNN